MAPCLEQAGEREGGGGNKGKTGVIRPRRANQIEVAVGMGVLQRRKGRDLSEAIRDRGEVVHAVVEDGPAQAFEPCGARWLVGGCLDQNGKQLFLGPPHGPPKAPEEVSICWKAGQMPSASAITPSAAATGSVRRTVRISVLADLSLSMALAEPRQPKAPARMPGLNAHLWEGLCAMTSPLSRSQDGMGGGGDEYL